MARLAWIASEVGSATGFPKRNHHTAKALADDGSEFWLDAAYSSLTLHAVNTARGHPWKRRICIRPLERLRTER
jgi:hypothetical protein